MEGFAAWRLGEAVPAGHKSHTALPEACLYWPAAHGVHASPSGPVKPDTHMQSTRSRLASAEVVWFGHARQAFAESAPTCSPYVPAEQFVHVAFPGDVLYRPALHSAHAPPLGPDAPALQEQSVRISLPPGASAKLPQASHTPASVALTTVENLPCAQLAHGALPGAVLNEPATQRAHGPPSGPAHPASQRQCALLPLAARDAELLGQSWHWSDAAPVTFEYCPGSHAAHATTAKCALKVPAAHAEQPLSSAPSPSSTAVWWYPGRHRQCPGSDALVRPTGSVSELTSHCVAAPLAQ